MALLEQFARKIRADESGATGDEDFHSGGVTLVVWRLGSLQRPVLRPL
jgi:hypothetical protein